MEALVIRDFYHRYTVDEHTLVAIESVLELARKKRRSHSAISHRKRMSWIC